MKKICVLVLMSLIYTQSFSQKEKAEKEFESLIAELKIIGLAVVVVKDYDIVYHANFGMQDIEKREKLNDSTIFRIASISKSFSATAIMQMVESKKLKLTDDFGKLVGFPIRNPKYPNVIITLKMVMSHTSSINDSQGYFNLDVINPAKNSEWAKSYSDYAPGTNYQYCNLNYNMTGAVIEKYSGERFDKHIKKSILDPLGLYAGYWVEALDSTRFATLYEYDSAKKSFNAAPAAYVNRKEQIKNYVMGYSTPVFSPTGGMKIGAMDLARYMTMHMHDGSYKNQKIISSKSAKLMRTKISEEEGYGLAIRQSTDLIPGIMLKGHTGSAYGLYSAMFFQPEEKFGFIVITNGCIADNNSDIRNVLRRSITILHENFIAKN